MRSTALYTLKALLFICTLKLATSCYDAYNADSTTSWIVEDSTPYYLAYDCGLKSTNVNQNGADVTLTIDNAGCSGSCSGKAYSCAEIAATQTSSHGYYNCKIKPAGIAGTVTSCEVISSTRVPFESIYFKFFGNDTTRVYTGYFANGISYSTGPFPTAFETDLDYHSYSIEWTTSYIKWYVDYVAVASAYGSRPLPTTPNRLVLNFLTETAGVTTDDSTIYTDDSVNRDFVMGTGPISSYFTNVSFVPLFSENCNQSASIIPSSNEYFAYDPNGCSLDTVTDVYTDTFASGWTSTSSTDGLSTTANAYVHTGSSSISWDMLPTSTLSFTPSNEIVLGDYYGFEFWINGGTGVDYSINVQLYMYLVYPNGKSDGVNLNTLLSSGVQMNDWSRAVVPWDNFGVGANYSIIGIQFFSFGKDFQGTVYIDDIRLTQRYPLCANRTLTMYSNGAVLNGFRDASWGSYSLTATGASFDGVKAARLPLYNSPGLQFLTSDGSSINTHTYQGVEFYVDISQLQGWNIKMAVIDGNGKEMATTSLLDYYGGAFPPGVDNGAGVWVRVAVPLYQFGVQPGYSVTGVKIYPGTQNYQGILMLDHVGFIESLTAQQATATSDANARLSGSAAAVASAAALSLLAYAFL